MNDNVKTKLLGRLRRISGQVEGIARMVEHDRVFGDLLLQIASVQAALGQASKLILQAHVETCVSEMLATAKASDRKQKLDELLQTFLRHGSLGSPRR